MPHISKFCVFCGAVPESKNREHIIPAWLIEMTGNPNREVDLGFDFTGRIEGQRRYAFDQFVVPACEACNTEFGHLESRAKLVVAAMLERQPLSAADCSTFLDWLDKVRAGLWLAMLMLNQNYQGIIPNYHIGQRLGAADRMVVVYECHPDGWEGVVWTGTDSPVFHAMPSCFAMTINQFSFVSVSREFLLAERMGLPYPSSRWLVGDRRPSITLAPGAKRMKLPVFPYEFQSGGRTLYQPAIPRGSIKTEGLAYDPYEPYQDAWVRMMFRDFDSGEGHVFLPSRHGLVRYSESPSTQWLPPFRLSRLESTWASYSAVWEILGMLYDDAPSMDRLTPDKRAHAESFMRATSDAHRTLATHFLSRKRAWLAGWPG